MKNKPTIAIDIDDVLSKSAEGFVAFSNKEFGTNLLPEQFTEDVAALWQVDHDEVVRRLKRYFSSDVVSTFRPIEGSADGLRFLSEHFKLIAITSRVEQMMPATEKWLVEHYDTPIKVYSTGIWEKLDKGAHKKTKADVCVKLGANYLIDDQVKHCTAASTCGIAALLFGEYAWNQTQRLSADIVRVKNWQEVSSYFEHDRVDF